MPINSGGHALRRLRRSLQGRGVEYRRFTGTSGAGSVTVTGMKGTDELLSVIRMPFTATEGLTDAIELLTETAGVATQASATPTQAGGNNDILWTAQSAYEGSRGNQLSVEILADTVLAVDVIAGVGGQETKVSIKINNTVTTANQVIDAVEAHPQARTMIYGKATEGTGDGVSVAVAATSLAGGVDANAPAVTRTVTPAVQAFLTTALAGTNNDVTWNAQLPGYPGTKGNSLSIEYLNPGTPNAALRVDVIAGVGGQETKVSVSLATDGASAITSTANQIIDAVEQHPQARTMLHGEATEGTGDGVVIALAATSLASGADESVAVAHAALTSTDRVMIDFLSHAA